MKQLIDVRAPTPAQLQVKVGEMNVQGYVCLEGGMLRDLQGNHVMLMVYSPKPAGASTPKPPIKLRRQ